ncbi:hypothetical protein AC1031_004849 [Aphanomyces cochlioides]|nr:hypothetical protein AC1031_004849 [Aphanomyces cochlioides]
MFRYYYTPTTTWDFVRPTYWHPMASLEQSLNELEALTQDMTLGYPLRAHSLLSAPSMNEDDEFFKDLPVAPRGMAATEQVPPASKEDEEATRAFSNYAYSSSSVVDDKGQRVESIRRRYEDANGRLKAVHERRMNGKKMVTTWRKSSKDDKGHHETLCSEGTTADEFEKMWKDTPFAKAHKSAESLETQETKTMEAEPAKASIQS